MSEFFRITLTEEYALIHAAKSEDDNGEAMERLLSRYSKLFIQLAKRLRVPGNDDDDNFAEVMSSAIKAVYKFEFDRNVRFITFLMLYVEAQYKIRITKLNRKKRCTVGLHFVNLVHVDSEMHVTIDASMHDLNALLAKLNGTEQQLAILLYQGLRPREIAKKWGKPLLRIREIKRSVENKLSTDRVY